MTLRADHIGGLLFVVGGLLVYALSGDLPFGTLAFPGAGFMPLIIATLLIVMGAMLALVGGRDSTPLAALDWGDLPHALAVIAIAAAATALYTVLGFLTVIPLMTFALLVVNERKGSLAAALYSGCVTLLTYWLFRTLKAQLPAGPFGF